MSGLRLVPISQAAAKKFIARHHRHNNPSITSVFNVGIADDSGLVGVAMASLPVARMLMDGYTLEVTRTCVKEGTPNANSMLYGACARVAKALGYRRLYTYTLPMESGVSLRAAGWTQEDGSFGGQTHRWATHTTHPGRGDYDMFGNERLPQGPKLRWLRVLTDAPNGHGRQIAPAETV